MHLEARAALRTAVEKKNKKKNSQVSDKRLLFTSSFKFKVNISIKREKELNAFVRLIVGITMMMRTGMWARLVKPL